MDDKIKYIQTVKEYLKDNYGVNFHLFFKGVHEVVNMPDAGIVIRERRVAVNTGTFEVKDGAEFENGDLDEELTRLSALLDDRLAGDTYDRIGA